MHPCIGTFLLVLCSAPNLKSPVEILHDFCSAKAGNELLSFTKFNPIFHSWQAFYLQGLVKGCPNSVAVATAKH